MRLLKDKHIFLILLGTLVWSLIMIKSGLLYPFGMGFWGPNGHDGVWHIALINSLSRFSLEMPIFSGEQVKNYHVGFDLFMALLHRLTFIPTHTLYFQLFPPLVAFLTGFLTYKFVEKWTASKNAAFWSTFFIYFGGSFGPIVSLIRDGHLAGESMFWSQQSISTLINPPFALSLVMLIAAFMLIISWEKKITSIKSIALVVLISLTLQIKVYAGILLLGGILSVGLYELLLRRKYKYLLLFASSSFLSATLFIPLNKSSTSLVVFQPFWFLETMMALSDRVGWPRFYEAMTNYKLGGNWVKLIPAYLLAFVIFWVGNMGTRIIKDLEIVRWVKNWENLTSIQILFASIILAGVVLPMLFLQQGTPWNTIQFLYYSLALSGILAGITFSEFISHKNALIKNFAIFALLLLTLPTSYATLKHYLPSRPPAMIPQEELQALEFLANQEPGVVLTFPYDSYKAAKAAENPPRPLYLYESTAYVSAFSEKPVFLEDEVNLNITGFDWKTRRKQVEDWLNTLNQKEAHAFLRQNNIRYIYWVKGQRARLGETQLGISRLYENKTVDIYKVD